MGRYTLTIRNEPNPDLLAEAQADVIMTQILNSNSPKRVYKLVLDELETQAEDKKIEAVAM